MSQSTTRTITVYVGSGNRKVSAEWVRWERVPDPASRFGRSCDTIVARLPGGRLIRTDDNGYEWIRCPYAVDRRYGADGRDLGPVVLAVEAYLGADQDGTIS